nr:isochorismatase family protein [uncultured Holophaga sp.]
MLPPTTALLLLCIQKGWDHPHWGGRSHPGAEACIHDLLEAFRSAGRPVVHIRQDHADPHSPLCPGQPGHAFKPEATPLDHELVLGKTGSSAFSGTGLEELLRRMGVDRLVVAGFTAADDVSSTVRSARDLGFRVMVMQDAVVAFELEDLEAEIIPPEEVHRVTMAELHGLSGLILETAACLPHVPV